MDLSEESIPVKLFSLGELGSQCVHLRGRQRGPEEPNTQGSPKPAPQETSGKPHVAEETLRVL